MNKLKNIDWPTCLLFAIAVSGLGVLTYEYLVAWRIAYSSDNALIGLMGKYILERGERPIYVWEVGYQGLVLEGYLMAVFFSMFGVGPISLNFAATLYLWLALGVWACVFIKAFGNRVAALAMVATVFSVPMFYELNLRSLPNFPEALLLGGLLFLTFEHLRAKYSAQIAVKKWRVLAFGFIAGFAFYTFAITVYFMLAITAALFVAYYRAELGAAPTSFITAWLMPWNEKSSVFLYPVFLNKKWNVALQKTLSAVAVLGWVLGLCAVVVCFLVPEPVIVFGGVKKWNSMYILFGAGGLVLLPRAGLEILGALQSSSLRRQLARFFGTGFLVGYSPALLFVLSGGQSKKQALASGNWPQLKMRLWVYEKFHEILLHFGDFWTWPFALYFLGCMVAFLGVWWIGLKKYVNDAAVRWPPATTFGFLFVVVFCIFTISKSVVDMASMRYLVLTVPICAAMLAWSTHWLWIHRPKLKWLAATGYLGVVGIGAASIVDDLSHPRSLPFETIARELQARSLKYSYADYWLAYATTFLSNEQVILEPLYSNYSPYYGPLVKESLRIGYVDYAPGRFPPKNGRVEINSQSYKVMEEAEVSPGIILRVLEKI